MMLVFILVLPIINAEMTMFNQVVIKDSEQIVRYGGSYYFDDTSANEVGKFKPIPMGFNIVVQALPFSLTTGYVDWCNMTVDHYTNIYDSSGNIINTTTYSVSVFYQNISLTSQAITVSAFASDYVFANMDCHYTNASELYEQNDLIGRFDTFITTFECKGCTKYSLEQLTNEAEKGTQISQSQLGIFAILDRIKIGRASCRERV